ncbi:MAG: ComEC family competence protein [Candidatus Omnitrophica bacterium]|nr:ComEC family competence protein [Candidatus Omnitrophota bacterium]
MEKLSIAQGAVRELLLRPVPWVCVFFILGIAAAAGIDFSLSAALIWCAVFLITAVFVVERPLLFCTAVAGSMYWLGIATALNAQDLPPQHVAHLARTAGNRADIRGYVLDPPQERGKKNVFVLRASAVQGEQGASRPLRGDILVWDFQKNQLGSGQMVRIRGKLFQPASFLVSKNRTYREVLRRKGIYAVLSIGREGQVRCLDSGGGLAAWMYRRRAGWQSLINRYCSPAAAAMVGAMVLGVRTDMPDFVTETLQRTGTVHILAVSGFNVGVIAVVIFTVVKLFFLPYRMRFVLTLAGIGLYCMLTGATPSVVRAGIMAGIFLLSFVFFREYDPLSGLGLAALLILLHAPEQLFDIGFQLSFLSVLSMFMLTPPLNRLMPEVWRRAGWRRGIWESVSLSLSAWLGTAGLVAYYFYMVTPVSVAANLFIGALVTAITVGGVVLLMAGGVPFLAEPIGRSVELFAAGIYRISAALAEIPGAYWYPVSVNTAGVAVYYLLFVGATAGLIGYARRIRAAAGDSGREAVPRPAQRA